jgi:hypothetical protein
MMTIRGIKKRTESKIKLRENDLIHSKEQTVVTANRYAALETGSSMPRNENGVTVMLGAYQRRSITILMIPLV